MDLCEFKASLVYRARSRTVTATQRNPVLKKKERKKERKEGRKEGRKKGRKKRKEQESIGK